MVISQKFPIEPKYDRRTSLNLVSFQNISIHKTFCNILPAWLFASRLYVSALDSDNKSQSNNFFMKGSSTQQIMLVKDEIKKF